MGGRYVCECGWELGLLAAAPKAPEPPPTVLVRFFGWLFDTWARFRARRRR